MRKQKLKACTIIPPELYVERNADRQLNQILEEMGRPGYVLVARQMGKTNLLLNAKRSREQTSDSFCYIDVSNVVPDIRSFFRSLIDICVDSFPERFEVASRSIRQRRELPEALLPHKEHEAELRDLLRSTSGRVVICLDEIDALTKTDYSDQVFSLIRSIYFSGRTNFSEFMRLTYVLSGVAEPSEIIKNRSISPFNIGEKIYLEDFSRSELDTFLRLADLELTDDIRDRIFYWTAGNPRMTWDVCAAIEGHPTEMSASAVDALVEQLYLRFFDLPPVDHIRMLAETDKEIRQGVMSIHYSKGDAVSDAVKSRLYLAGITAGFGSELQIKNKIIDAALSEKWLNDIEKKAKSLFDYANTLFSDERYLEALAAYEEFEATRTTFEDLPLLNFYKGSCQYFLGRYSEAIETLQSSSISKSYSVDYYTSQLARIASAQLLLGDLPNSIEAFEKILEDAGTDDSDRPMSFYQASLNLSAAYLRTSPPNLDRVIDLCTSVIAASQKRGTDASTDRIYQRFTYVAHFNLHRAYFANQDLGLALEAIDKAIDASSVGAKCALLLEKAQNFDKSAQRVETLRECVDHCIRERIAVTKVSPLEHPLSFSADVAARLIEELSQGRDASKADLDRLQEHLSDSTIDHESGIHALITRAVNYAFQHSHSQNAFSLFTRGAMTPSTDNEEEERRYLIGVAMIVCPIADLDLISDIYVRDYLQNGKALSDYEYRAVYRVVRELLSKGKAENAETILNLMLSARENNPADENESAEFIRLILAYLSLSVRHALEPLTDIDNEALLLHSEIAGCKEPVPQLFPDDFKLQLLSQVASLCPKAFMPKQVQRTSRRVGRNEVVRVKFKDGTITKGKYKKFESQIRLGEVELLPS